MIKNNLKQIMDKLGICQADVVRGTGLPKSVVSNLYHTKDLSRMSFRNVVLVENYLGSFYTIEDDMIKESASDTFVSTISKCTSEKELVQVIKRFYKLKSKQPFRVVFKFGTPVRMVEELPLMIDRGKIYAYYKDGTKAQSIDLLHHKNNIYCIETNPYLYKVGDVVPVNNSGYKFYGVIKKIDPEMNVVFKNKGKRVVVHISEIIDSYMLTRTLNDVPYVITEMVSSLESPSMISFVITSFGRCILYDLSAMSWAKMYDISENMGYDVDLTFNSPYIIPTLEQFQTYTIVKDENK